MRVQKCTYTVLVESLMYDQAAKKEIIRCDPRRAFKEGGWRRIERSFPSAAEKKLGRDNAPVALLPKRGPGHLGQIDARLDTASQKG